jgi:hypothetical protein
MTTSSLDADRTTGPVSPPDVTATLAAGALMMTSAVLTFLIGVFALAADNVVVTGPGYQYTFQITGWGWSNIVTGMVLAAFAIALLFSAEWARAAAIIVTCLAIVVTFLWMPYYPTGSIVLIALDIAVVWGVGMWNSSRKTA